MSNVGLQISGASASSFSLGASTCGATLANGSNCTVQVLFTPAAAGAESASLTLSSSTFGVQSLVVPLNGTGASPAALSVAPPQLSFAAQAIGQPSAAQTVTVSNSGASAAAGLALTATGPFSLTQNTCASSLAAAASCSTGVVFTPMQTGNLTGTLTVSSTSVSPPTTVALTGIGGLTGAVQVQPAQLSFASTGVGVISSASTVTFTNTSTSVALDNVLLAVSSGFQLSATTCAAQLAAGASCTASVTFAPTAAGAATGTLAFTSSSLAAPVTVPLTGTGFDFTLSNSGSLTQTVSSGATATFTLTLTPSAGVSATFTFQCNALPTYATCTFDPSSNTVAANATGTETIQIATSQASGQLVRPLGFRASSGMVLLCGVLFLPFARRKRRMLLAVFTLAALTFVASCASSGGGGGSTPPSGGSTNNTAAGTYSIPVVVTANGEQHTITLTLVVD